MRDLHECLAHLLSFPRSLARSVLSVPLTHTLSGAPSGETARREISLALSVPLPSHSLSVSLSLSHTMTVSLPAGSPGHALRPPPPHSHSHSHLPTHSLTLTLALTNHSLAHSLSFSHSLKIFLSLFPIYLARVLAVTQPSPTGRTAARACLEFSLIRTLTFIHTRSLTHSLTHTHTHTLTHSHIGAQSGESLSRILSHTHTHIHTHSLTHSLTLILTHSHTHTWVHRVARACGNTGACAWPSPSSVSKPSWQAKRSTPSPSVYHQPSRHQQIVDFKISDSPLAGLNRTLPEVNPRLKSTFC